MGDGRMQSFEPISLVCPTISIPSGLLHDELRLMRYAGVKRYYEYVANIRR